MKNVKGKNRAAAQKFVKLVISNNNVKAKDQLEAILKEKVARRIKDTLAS